MTQATPVAERGDVTAEAPQGPDPTLVELAREGSRWAKAGLLLLAVAVLVAALSVTVLRPGKPKGGGASVRSEGPPAFTMDYARGELKVVANGPDRVELVDRGADRQGSRVIVTPLTLPEYQGSPTGALPLASEPAQRTIVERFDPGSVRFVDEGLVNIGPNPGYQLSYTAKRDGQTWYGRAAVVVPDVDGERAALLMDGQEQRVSRGKISGPRAVGRQGDLRRPMRSLAFVD